MFIAFLYTKTPHISEAYNKIGRMRESNNLVYSIGDILVCLSIFFKAKYALCAFKFNNLI